MPTSDAPGRPPPPSADPVAPEPPTGAVALPAVVVVVVAHDPGPWFEQTLDALCAQDYPNLAVLVIDAASTEPVAQRCRSGGPVPLHVHRLETNPGYGAAANAVLDLVEGAAFYCFCHDDIAPDPDAVRRLVEEAVRSNAAVVGPKHVQWSDPRRLRAVGMSVDRTGHPVGFVDDGELDQSQHDAVRDVFWIPGGMTLVRSDIFGALGGYDPAITYLGEDLDLCWRVHVAGGRVLVNPAARVRHIEALGHRRPTDDRRRLQSRHRIRTVLVTSSRWRLAWIVPLLVIQSVAEMAYGLLSVRPDLTRDMAAAWRWNLRRLGQIRRRRRDLRHLRTVSDRDLSRLQVRGWTRLRLLTRGPVDGPDLVRSGIAAASRTLRPGGAEPVTVAAGALLVAVAVFGSRHLVTRRVPVVGHLVGPGGDAGDLLAAFLGSWRFTGLGSVTPPPTLLAPLAGLTAVTGGHPALVRTVLVVGTLPVGWWGAHRLARRLGSPRAAAAAAVAYASVPVGYDAMAAGRLDGLVCYAGAPWLIARMLDVVDEPPGRAGRRVVGLGLVVAVIATPAPLAVPVVLLAAVGLAAGGARPLRLVGVTAAACGLAVVLHLPWSVAALHPAGGLTALGGLPGAGVIDEPWSRVVRLGLGEVRGLPGWLWMPPAAFGLVIARGGRAAIVRRAWTLIAVSWVVVWVVSRSAVAVATPSAPALLAPAAAGAALAVATGVAAFEADLRHHGLGWRQVAAVVALASAVGAAAVPAAAAVGGRWGQPSRGLERVFGFLDDQPEARTVWLGRPGDLPVAGWGTTLEGVVWATTRGGPDVTELWPGPVAGATGLLGAAVDDLLEGRTARLGERTGPMAVRWFVVPAGGPGAAVVADRLAQQLDLREVIVDPRWVVFENDAWVPELAAFEGSGVPAGPVPGAPAASGAPASDGSASLTVPAGAVVLAETGDDGWRLRVDGTPVARSDAYGWANGWEVPGGRAELTRRPSFLRWATVAGQALVWALALITWRRWRRPDAPAAVPAPGSGRAGAPVPGAPPVPAGGGRRP